MSNLLDNIAQYGVIAAVLGLVTVVYYFRRWYRLRDFKGPWLASFSEVWLARVALSGSFHTILMDASKKYGMFVQVTAALKEHWSCKWPVSNPEIF